MSKVSLPTSYVSLFKWVQLSHSFYRESLKNASQVVRIRGEKIAFSCLQKVNKTQIFHPISHNLGSVL